jgi:Rad3-related DNA helicase
MVGRLIRSEDDGGLVVIVDARREREYFERVSAALPPGCPLQIATRAQLRSLVAELALGRASQSQEVS